MVNWLLAIGAIVGGYFAIKSLGARDNGASADNREPDVTIGVGTGVTTGVVGSDIAGSEQAFDQSFYGGIAQGFAVGGVAGGIIASIVGAFVGVFRDPPSPPIVERWGMPYRPEWTIWDDVKKTATFYVPGPNEGVEPVEITFSFDKLLELFNGVDIDTIKSSGIVSWRPGDGADPINEILYHDDVAGGWLPLWEQRHFRYKGDYENPTWGFGPYPRYIRWIDLWKSDPRKFEGEMGATRAIIQARRLAYFQAIDSSFTMELAKFFHYASFHRGEWTSDGKAIVADKVIADQKETNDAPVYGTWFCYALANACKVYIPPYQDFVDGYPKGKLSVDDVDKNKDVSKIPTYSNGDIVLLRGDAQILAGSGAPVGGSFKAIYDPIAVSAISQHPHRGFPYLWSVDNA